MLVVASNQDKLVGALLLHIFRTNKIARKQEYQLCDYWKQTFRYVLFNLRKAIKAKSWFFNSTEPIFLEVFLLIQARREICWQFSKLNFSVMTCTKRKSLLRNRWTVKWKVKKIDSSTHSLDSFSSNDFLKVFLDILFRDALNMHNSKRSRPPLLFGCISRRRHGRTAPAPPRPLAQLTTYCVPIALLI